MSASRGEFAAVGGSDLCWSDLAIDDVPAELHRQFDGERRRLRRAFVENGPCLAGAAAEAVEAGQQPAARLPIDRVMRLQTAVCAICVIGRIVARASAAAIRHAP